MESVLQGRYKCTIVGSSRESSDPIAMQTWKWGTWSPIYCPSTDDQYGWPGGGLKEPLTHPLPGLVQYLPDILPKVSTRHCLPSEGTHRQGDDPQHTLGKLCSRPHVGHGSDYGQGEPPPPVFSQVWYVRHMERAKCQEPGHGDVLQGRGDESEATTGGRGAEVDGGGLSGVWKTIIDGVKIPQ